MANYLLKLNYLLLLASFQKFKYLLWMVQMLVYGLYLLKQLFLGHLLLTPIFFLLGLLLFSFLRIPYTNEHFYL